MSPRSGAPEEKRHDTHAARVDFVSKAVRDRLQCVLGRGVFADSNNIGRDLAGERFGFRERS
jgi:hypothetical protein